MNRAVGCFFCWCCAGALGLSGLLACAESVCWECEVVQLMRGGCAGFRGAVAWSEMSIKPLALPRWLALFLATDLILGTDRFGLVN